MKRREDHNKGKKHRLIDIFVIYGMFVAKVVIINKTINLTGT
jgi:hypothetical protein